MRDKFIDPVVTGVFPDKIIHMAIWFIRSTRPERDLKESDPPKSLCALTYVQTPFSGHPKLRISSLQKVILLHRAVIAQSSLHFHINIFVVYFSFCTVYYLWTIATFRTVIEWDSVPVQKFLRRNGDESSQDGTSTEARRNQTTQIARVNV